MTGLVVSAPGLAPQAPADWYSVRLAASKSYPFFIEHVAKNDAIRSRYGFHRQMADFISCPRAKRKPIRMVLAPRTFLKSTYCSLLHSIWLLMLNPEETILLMHGIADKAEEYVGEIHSIISDDTESSGMLRWIAPDVFGDDPRRDIRMETGILTVKRRRGGKTPSILAAGERSSIAGLHFSRYKFDDLVNDANYKTEAARLSTIECFQIAMGTRKGDDSLVDIADTIYHPNDLTQWIQNPDNKVAKLLEVWQRDCWYEGPRESGDGNYAPGEASEWPEKRSVDFLLEQQTLLGPAQFSQQFLLHPSAEGARLFKLEWVRRYQQRISEEENAGGEPRVILPGTDEEDVERRAWEYVMAIDAVSKGEKATDRACILAGAWNDLGQLYLLDVFYDRPSPSAFFDLIYEWYLRWNPKVMFFEDTGAMAYVHEDLLRDMKERKASYPIFTPKRYGGSRGGQKQGRIEAIEPFAAEGKLFAPDDRKWAAPLSEIEGYRLGQKDQRDDFLDTLSDLVRHPRHPISPDKVREAERALHAVGDAAHARLRGITIGGMRGMVRESSRGRRGAYNPYGNFLPQ